VSPAPDSDFVFNIVWNGTVFTYLRYFVASQIAQSDARFRFIVNACPPEQVALIEQFAEKHPDRVVEVFEASGGRMVGHGDALDAVRAVRDDGPYFSFIDPDILAKGPFLAEFSERLDGECAAITSGRGVWCESDVIPEGHPGVSGEFFYAQDGYLFGSPHFAIYERAPVDATIERWNVGFGSGGPDLSDEAKAQLAACGQDYWLYDTAKIVNILFQEDGNRLCHIEHPQLMHIGGMSHYLSPPKWSKWVVLEEGEDPEPEWATWAGMESRFEVARFTAVVLRNVCEGFPAPEIPADLDPSMEERLVRVRDAIVQLVAKYEAEVLD
jgi:hypothetical protein